MASHRVPAPGVSEATTLHGPGDDDGEHGGRVLRVIGPDRFETHALPASGRLLLGRSTEADICILHTSISRKHAALHVGRLIELEDLGSANGTSVGGRALASGERAPLAVGALATLGTLSVVVQRSAAPDVEVPDGERMRPLHDLVERVAPSTLSVLLVGETGVGKDVFANAIHRRSPRRDAPFVTLNCAAFSEALLESELFGYERGAFTGAVGSKPGLLESAEGGTVFLDEIGELPLNLQPKLLRVIEDRQVRRLGALKSRAIDVRFLAATNRDLERAVEGGSFRSDLYFRLAGVTLAIPPLRERLAEIATLARSFVARAASASGRPAPELTHGALRLLEGYAWPGNIRELRNVVERAVLLATGSTIDEAHLPVDRMIASPYERASHGAATMRPPAPLADPSPSSPTGSADRLRSALREAEKQRVVDALHACGGNQSQAAKRLGISRNTLLARLDEHGLPRPRKR